MSNTLSKLGPTAHCGGLWGYWTVRGELDTAGRSGLGKNWTLPDGMDWGKTGHYRAEWTGERLDTAGQNELRTKLDTAGQNELRTNWTLPDRMNCGQIGHCRTELTADKINTGGKTELRTKLDTAGQNELRTN